MIDRLIPNILRDLRVELADEFDRNFERKAFFDQPWAPVKENNPLGSLMMRSGDLRKSILAYNDSDSVRFESSSPYAVIHNDGGVVRPQVTARMKQWAWYMYKETKLEHYKWLALTKKTNLEITIPQRQFIGEHREVDRIVEEVVTHRVNEAFNSLFRNS